MSDDKTNGKCEVCATQAYLVYEGGEYQCPPCLTAYRDYWNTYSPLEIAKESNMSKDKQEPTTENKPEPGTPAPVEMAIGLTATFEMDKETDGAFRLRGPNSADLFGSLYVKKAAFPEGATTAKVTVEFV